MSGSGVQPRACNGLKQTYKLLCITIYYHEADFNACMYFAQAYREQYSLAQETTDPGARLAQDHELI